MKLETYLNAMAMTRATLYDTPENIRRRSRQYRAFRARIIRMDKEKDKEIHFLNVVIDKCEVDIKRLENDSTTDAG